MQITEQPSLYDHLEKKSVREILEDINREDQKVASAVQKAIPQIEHLVNLIVPRMRQGGRIFYMGAGTSGRLGVLDASEVPPTFGMSPVAGRTDTYQDCSDAVALYIIIHPVTCRNRKKFHTGISPYRTVVRSVSGTHTRFFNFKM